MTGPCVGCGTSVFDHQPVLNPNVDGPLFLRGPGISDPGGWATDDDTGERVFIEPTVSTCEQYLPERQPA